MVNASSQRLCAWAGPACIVVFFVGFWPIAGFMPPPSPTNSPAQVAAFYAEHTTAIRLGLVIGMFAAALLGMWSGGISVQLKRIEGIHSPLTYAQLVLGAALPLIFILPMMFWEVAAFRPDRPAGETVLLNDLGWLPFVGVVFTGVPWAIAIGLAILRDPRPEPVFPRWSGYLTLWVSLIFTPGCLVVFFKTGPFAWNGPLAFWMVILVFAGWSLMFSWLLLRAIDRQQWERVRATDRADSASPVAGLG
jgi:hypothetical protein